MKKGKHIQSSKNGILQMVLLVVMSFLFIFIVFALILSVDWDASDEQEIFKAKGNRNGFFEAYNSNDIEVSAMNSIENSLQQNSHFETLFNNESIRNLTFTASTHKIYKFNTQQNYLALTFDDCPIGDMQMILDVLDEYDMRCTFFMLGEYIKFNKGWAKEVTRRGHTVANHSYDHANFQRLNEKNIKNQLDKTAKLIEEETDITPVMFRPPYGSSNDEVEKICNEKGYTIALWSVDSLDWKDKEHAYERAAEAKSGDVVLFHTLHVSKEGLTWLLQEYKSKGLKSIPMEELVILEMLENHDTTSLKELGLKLK